MVSNYFQDPKYIHLRRALRNNLTEPEQILWSRLRRKQLGGYKFIRQYGIGHYITDFYCPAKHLVIELDGAQHSEPEALKSDADRTAYINQLNIKVIRFWNHEVMHNLEIVCDEILRELEA